MFKLILVFGVWINPNYVTNLSELSDECLIEFVGDKYKYVVIKKTCQEVVDEINKQMERSL